jgi:hypothetical protein
MSNGENLVPASIVQLIFNQVKQSTDSNTESIKTLTIAINELVKILLDGPSRKEIMDKIEVIETRQVKRDEVLINTVYAIRDAEDIKRKESVKAVEEYIEETQQLVTTGKTTCADAHTNLGKAVTDAKDTINRSIYSLVYNLKIFLAVLALMMSMFGLYHYYVDKNLDKTVEHKIEHAVEQIITSRPGSVVPPINEKVIKNAPTPTSNQ